MRRASDLFRKPYGVARKHHDGTVSDAQLERSGSDQLLHQSGSRGGGNLGIEFGFTPFHYDIYPYLL